MSGNRSVLITSAPPNPNGDLHLGHLSGPFLGADVLRRYLRQVGVNADYVSYTDDYSSYVSRKASEVGSTAPAVAEMYSRRMVETLALAAMLPDYFEHPAREPVHARFVHQHFLRLWQSNTFDVRVLPVFFCVMCTRYLYEGEVRGRCHFCRAPSDGVYCEECGRLQDTTGLLHPRCTACGREPEVRSLKRIVFPLARYEAGLKRFFSSRPWKPRLLAYWDSLQADGLPDVPVSRVCDYGLTVPLDEWKGHVLDTWYSGIFGYMAATAALMDARGEREGGWSGVWSTEDAELVQFIGFDCSFSHAVLWPALLMALGDRTLPTAIITNEFYRLNGEKFSTSRGHAIWGGDLLRRVPADSLRFYLSLTGPESEESNFVMTEFSSVVDKLLAHHLEDYVQSVLELLSTHFGGRVPSSVPRGDDTLLHLLTILPQQMREALEPRCFSLHRAAELISEATEAASASLRRHRLTGDDLTGEAVAHSQLLAVLTAVSAPIMPCWAQHLWSHLGLPFLSAQERVLPWPSRRGLVPAGHVFPQRVPAYFQPSAESKPTI